MTGRVYPAGYARHSALIEQLMANPKTLLIDIRFLPETKFKGWAGDDLKRKWGKRYRFAGKYLGNLRFHEKGKITIVNPATGIAGLVQYLQEGYDLILVCGCASYDQCHRRLVVDLLRSAMPGVKIVMPEQIVKEK